MEGELRYAFDAVGGVEEACEGLGQCLGEAQPALADLLAAPPLLGGDAGDDLEQELVDEGLSRCPNVVGRTGGEEHLHGQRWRRGQCGSVKEGRGNAVMVNSDART